MTKVDSEPGKVFGESGKGRTVGRQMAVGMLHDKAGWSFRDSGWGNREGKDY